MLFRHLIERHTAIRKPRRLLATHATEKSMHAIVPALHTRMLQL